MSTLTTLVDDIVATHFQGSTVVVGEDAHNPRTVDELDDLMEAGDIDAEDIRALLAIAYRQGRDDELAQRRHPESERTVTFNALRMWLRTPHEYERAYGVPAAGPTAGQVVRVTSVEQAWAHDWTRLYIVDTRVPSAV